MNLNRVQPPSPVKSSQHEASAPSAPPSTGAGWNPSHGVRFANQQPNSSSATPPGSAFTYDHGTNYVRNNTAGTVPPDNFAQQLQQQFQQKQPTLPAPSAASPPPPSSQHYPPYQQRQPSPPRDQSTGWDPSKGLFFGGKPKN